MLLQIASATVLLIAAAVITKIFEINYFLKLLIFLVPYFTVGIGVLKKAALNICHGRVFDENFLMCIATVGAFAIGKFPEAVFVMLFYQTGELFQSIAVGKSRRSIAALMDIKPEEATVIRDGNEITVSPEEIEVGETIIVKAGEKIPLDGIITEGEASLQCMALTGESEPQYVRAGDRAVSGAINQSGVLKIEVSSKYEDSTVAKILALVENASAVKSKTDRFITRFARVYTPAAVILALLIFAVPSLITREVSEWLYRALIFLVISCPCALVISVPLSYFGGLGTASKKGILIKGACYLEALAEAENAVFDKTGTLTEGSFAVSSVFAAPGVSLEALIKSAYAAEKNSNHPVALAVSEYCRERAFEELSVSSVEEISGMGIRVNAEKGEILAGNARLMQKYGISACEPKERGSIVYVAENGEFLGYFTVSDKIKPSAAEAVRGLKRLGIKRVAMLTGDRRENAEAVASEIGEVEVHAELMPGDKVSELEVIMSRCERGGRTVYVGDGINDAPVLARADVGIAMGAIGSDAAIEAADVVLMDDDPRRVAEAVSLARKTKRIVMENIVFAIGIKVLFMLLGAFGIANLWLAVFADVGVSVIAILNSMRMLAVK